MTTRHDSGLDYLDLAQVAVVVLDANGRVRRINRKGCEILGRDRAAIVGKSWFESFVPERLRERLTEVHGRWMAGIPVEVEFFESPIVDGAGVERSMEWHNTVLKDESGRIVGTLSAGVDVTGRRRSAQQEALAAVGRMAAVVAHEVKNPLAGIAGAIEIIGGRLPDDSRDREVIASILKRIEALNRRVQELLQFSHPRAPRIGSVGVPALLKETAALLARDPTLANVVVEVSAEEMTLAGDAEMLKDLFLNLFLNAAQAMGGSGRVRVVAGSRNGRCRIAVSDRGVGIPAAHLARIFEPFFTTKNRGTGLGLAITKQLVDAHDGEIGVDSAPGRGTTVTVSLPVGPEGPHACRP